MQAVQIQLQTVLRSRGVSQLSGKMILLQLTNIQLATRIQLSVYQSEQHISMPLA